MDLLGNDFVELSTEKSYKDYFECTPCELDTSLVLIGKSDGGQFNNEFVLYHNSISFKANSELLKLMRQTYVTVNEYEEFENWVRDSIARMRLAEFTDRWQKSEEFANFEWEPAGSNNRFYVLKSLKWNKRLSYDDPDLMPFLADMYLPQPQRFYKQRIFDKRKYNYRYIDEYELLNGIGPDSIQFYVKDADRRSSRYDEVHYHVPIIRDEFVLGNGSAFVRDERSTILHFREKVLADFPANGIRGYEADAFCHWKARKIQEQLSKKGMNYSVRVTLPLVKDVENVPQNQLDEIIVPPKEYTDLWKITNGEYLDFMNYVKDSITREQLFFKLSKDEEAIQFVNYRKNYFDEGALEFVDFDISDRNEWRVFNLNKKHTINVRDTNVTRVLKSLSDDQLYSFRYYDMNFEKRAEVGEFIPDNDQYRRSPPIAWTLKSMYSDGEPFGKDWALCDPYTPLGEAKCTRTHVNLQRFIEPNLVDVRPPNFKEIMPNDSVITTITYAQALAFYHWKFPVERINEKSNWQDFVLPTKEQYELIERGESVVIEEHTIHHEGPFFRYVVHLFPK